MELVQNVKKEEKIKLKEQKDEKHKKLTMLTKKKSKNALDQFDDDENVNEI